MTSRRLAQLLVLPLAASLLLAGCSVTYRPDRPGETDVPETDQMAVTTDCAVLVPSAAASGFVQITVDPSLEDDSDLSGIEEAGGTVCYFRNPATGEVFHVGAQLIQGNEADRRARRWERDNLLAVDGVGDTAYFTAATNDVNGDSWSELRVLSGSYYVQVGVTPSADAAVLAPLAVDAIGALG